MKDLLSHFSAIDCIGKNSKTFLQGQLTCDLNTLTLGKSSLAAHCNLQGRIVSLFHLTQLSDEHYRLVLPKTMVSIALEALKKYAVFSKVTFNEVPIEESISSEWRRNNILAGIPAVYPETSGLFIPQRLNLVELGGISFKKGCYLGQEIVSRLYFKGTVKHHMVLTTITPAECLLPGEIVIDANGKTCGHVVDSTEDYALVEKMIETPFPLFIQGKSCRLLLHK